MKKRFFEELKIIFYTLLPIICAVLVIALCLLIDWLIATSNLPPWFKFALLNRK